MLLRFYKISTELCCSDFLKLLVCIGFFETHSFNRTDMRVTTFFKESHSYVAHTLKNTISVSTVESF